MFSDKETFPSFMRTVPSDRWQVAAMVQLLKEFGWNWVSIVGSDDEYGQKGQQQFSSMANEESICVAYQGLIPVYSDPEPAIKEILNRIVDAKVGVVVVFSLPKPARDFFIEVNKLFATLNFFFHIVKKKNWSFEVQEFRIQNCKLSGQTKKRPIN